MIQPSQSSSISSDTKYQSFRSHLTDRSRSVTYQRPEKVVLVFGFFGVGKSSLISRYILEHFPNFNE